MYRCRATALSLVALLGLLNWCTTCCCGRSAILELFEGGCDCGHDHGDIVRDTHSSSHARHGHEHGLPDGHSCHKATSDWNSVGPDRGLLAAPDSLPPIFLATDTDPVQSLQPSARFRDSTARAGPPDIPIFLRLQILLI